MKLSLSANLSLTPKGKEEATSQVHNINERQRKVLIQLGTPQTVEQIINQRVGKYSQAEIVQLIIELINGGYVVKDGGPAASPVVISASGEIVQITDDFVLSEAKFLLVDFCVDSFGTRAQTYIEQIDGCKDQTSLKLCLKNIHAVTQSECPDRLPALMKAIVEIKKTAY
jgi:hypothetical protein